MAPVDQAFNEWSLCYLVSIFRILMPLFPGTCLSQPRLSGDENAPISIKLTPLGSDLLGPYFGGLKHDSSQRAASSIAFRHFGYILKILLLHIYTKDILLKDVEITEQHKIVTRTTFVD